MGGGVSSEGLLIHTCGGFYPGCGGGRTSRRPTASTIADGCVAEHTALFTVAYKYSPWCSLHGKASSYQSVE